MNAAPDRLETVKRDLFRLSSLVRAYEDRGEPVPPELESELDRVRTEFRRMMAARGFTPDDE